MNFSWPVFLLLLCCVQVFSGPNQNARIRVDMEPSTYGISLVEASITSAAAEESLSILVVAENVSNLDAYVYRLIFDTTKLRYLASDYHYGDRKNVLDNAGTCIGVPIRRIAGVNSSIDTLEMARTLVGSDSLVAPDGFGLLGSVRFLSRLSPGQSANVTIVSATFLDTYLEGDSILNVNRFGGGYNYVIPMLSVAVAANPAGKGTVTLDPSGGSYAQNSTVNATATAAPGYLFAHWSGSLTGTTNPISFNVNAPKSITANFTPIPYTLTLSVIGSGNVTGSPAKSTYFYDEVVTLTPVPLAGWRFVRWEGDLTGNTSPGAVTIRSNASISAVFEQERFVLTVTGGANGSATPSTPVSLASGQNVTISAAPVSGFFFDRWTVVSGTAHFDDRFTSTTTAYLESGNATVRADFVAAGTIQISGIGTESKVFLHATNGWQGGQVRTGAGTIGNLKPGAYQLCVQEPGMRPEYQSAVVSATEITTIRVTLRPDAPMAFDSLTALKAGSTPIATGSPNSAVLEDFDRDGDLDLLIGRSDGTFDFYDKQSAGFVAASSPRTSSGSPLTVPGGVLALRAIDWKHDNTLDLAILTTGPDRVVLYPQLPTRGERTYGSAVTLYTAISTTALTGFDIADLNRDGYPDLVLGYRDGTIKVVNSSPTFSWTAPEWQSAQQLTLSGGAPVKVVANAMPCLVDVSGDGLPDLLVGGSDGKISYFAMRPDGSVRSRGTLLTSGRPLTMSGTAVCAKSSGGLGEFPLLIVSDGTGSLYRSPGSLRGDLSKAAVIRDGVVRIEDLSIFGDAWGATEGSVGWNWECNLDPTPGPNGVQVIDLFDLSLFGDSWLTEK